MIHPLQILFSTGALDNVNEGPARAVTQLASALVAAGDGVTVVGTVGLGSVAEELDVGTRTIPLPRTGPSNIHFVAGLSRYREAIGAADCISVHGVWVYLNHQVIAMFGKNTPYMMTTHGCLNLHALGIRPFKKWLASRLYAKRLLEGARCLRALNDAEYQSIRAAGFRNPICVIPNGVCLPSLMPPSSVPGHDIRTCLFLGRIHPIKGVDLLVGARQRVAPKNWRLVIAGPAHGRHEQELMAASNASVAKQGISFVGPANGHHKDELLRSADLIALPSHSEGLPMQLLEGMAYAKPILMTRACNLSEAVAAGAGVECDTTVDSLAEALAATTMLDRATLEVMGRRGRELAEVRFSWPQIASAVREVQFWITRGGSIPATVRTS